MHIKTLQKQAADQHEAASLKLQELQREREDLSSQCELEHRPRKLDDGLWREETRKLTEGLQTLERSGV